MRKLLLFAALATASGCAAPGDVARQQCQRYLDAHDWKGYDACYSPVYDAAEDRQQRQQAISQALIQAGAAMQAAAPPPKPPPQVTTTNCNAVGRTVFCNSVTQ